MKSTYVSPLQGCTFVKQLREKLKLIPMDPTSGEALKGHNSKAMGLDPSTNSLMDLQALKGRNNSTLRQAQDKAISTQRNGSDSNPNFDEISSGNYFALSGLGSLVIHPTMGQDPSFYYIAPLGLLDRGRHILRYRPIRAELRELIEEF